MVILNFLGAFLYNLGGKTVGAFFGFFRFFFENFRGIFVSFRGVFNIIHLNLKYALKNDAFFRILNLLNKKSTPFNYMH